MEMIENKEDASWRPHLAVYPPIGASFLLRFSTARTKKEDDGGRQEERRSTILYRPLLQVMLNSAFITDSGLVGILSGMAACSTLAQQIPALIQLHL
jgi:hypothetical protein